MFDEIGKKIKKLAEVLCWIGIIASVIIAIVLWSIGSNSYDPDSYILSGFLVGAIGSLFSWVGSFFMYGFGELIDNSQKINKKLNHSKITPSCSNKISNYTANNLKICMIDTHASVGTCDLCGRESVVIRECEIKDGFSKMYRKLCEKCISKHGGSLNTNTHKETVPLQTPAFGNKLIYSASDVVSSPKEKNTKMCLACGRVLPVAQKECPCGSETFDDDKNI